MTLGVAGNYKPLLCSSFSPRPLLSCLTVLNTLPGCHIRKAIYLSRDGRPLPGATNTPSAVVITPKDLFAIFSHGLPQQVKYSSFLLNRARKEGVSLFLDLACWWWPDHGVIWVTVTISTHCYSVWRLCYSATMSSDYRALWGHYRNSNRAYRKLLLRLFIYL